MTGGTSILLDGRVPHPSWWGYPILPDKGLPWDGGTPSWNWMGILPSRTGLGTPIETRWGTPLPVGRQNSYAACGMSLAFTQENFLVEIENLWNFAITLIVTAFGHISLFSLLFQCSCILTNIRKNARMYLLELTTHFHLNFLFTDQSDPFLSFRNPSHGKASSNKVEKI